MLDLKLNMQIICDMLIEKYEKVYFFSQGDSPCLDGVRFYHADIPLEMNYAYLLPSADINFLTGNLAHRHLLLCGKTDHTQIPPDCTSILIEDADDILRLFTQIQETFEKYHRWNNQLHSALNEDQPLDSMLSVSLPIFNNPIFVHDPNFYVLSCPHHVKGMLIWEREPRTGLETVPLDVINDFKADQEYLRTLKSQKASLFSAEQRGYEILYVNLWNHGHYEGRICIDELESAIKPGQYHLAEHLSKIILTSMRSNSLFRLSLGNDLDAFFTDYLDGKAQDQFQTMKILSYLSWNLEDHYLCMRLEADQRDIQMLSSAATLGHIEAQIPSCHAFIYHRGISVITNLTYAKQKISDILRSLALILREGLLKMGASSELAHFRQIPQGMFQAQMALELGQNSQSMTWYYRFDDYILEFLVKRAKESLDPELIASAKLLRLRDYDALNNTDLYHTLQVYLSLEQNVLQTANTLFIHRSTLFYRLERIRKITGVNLEDDKERLTLGLSYYILEQQK